MALDERHLPLSPEANFVGSIVSSAEVASQLELFSEALGMDVVADQGRDEGTIEAIWGISGRAARLLGMGVIHS